MCGVILSQTGFQRNIWWMVTDGYPSSVVWAGGPVPFPLLHTRTQKNRTAPTCSLGATKAVPYMYI